MQKKKTTKPQKPVETLPAVDDFFTQFLDKKKKNYTKKLEKIDGLQKKNFDELTPEQKELVNNRQKVVEDAVYYDEIKQLYFQANAKKDGQKQGGEGATSSNSAVLGLYYLGKCTKEHGETAMRAMSGYGIEFQEKVHRHHHRVFQSEGFNAETLNRAEQGLNEFTADAEFTSQLNNLWTEGKLTQKAEEVQVKEVPRKEFTNKPQLFAMSSDEEDEEEVHEQPKKHDNKAAPSNQENANFKPTFVSLPEDDNEEGFGFETNQQGRGERRDRKPRGDRPARKYDGERRGGRREYGDKKAENGNNEPRQEGEEAHTEQKPNVRGTPSRGRGYDKEHEVNKESGERRKPFGRGKHVNKEQRDDNMYQKKEAKLE